MAEVILTTKAKKLLRVLFAAYKERMSRNITHDDANRFHDDEDIKAFRCRRGCLSSVQTCPVYRMPSSHTAPARC